MNQLSMLQHYLGTLLLPSVCAGKQKSGSEIRTETASNGIRILDTRHLTVKLGKGPT